MKSADWLRGEKVNIDICTLLIGKIQSLFLPVDLNNTNPFVHILLCSFVVHLFFHSGLLTFFNLFDLHVTIDHEFLSSFSGLFWGWWNSLFWSNRSCQCIQQIRKLKFRHLLVSIFIINQSINRLLIIYQTLQIDIYYKLHSIFILISIISQCSFLFNI